ncbi:nucleotide sugar dehydrogenase [Halorubrum sp. DTA46]|uniref:nucleotide sugar dehydrogenase n=1 Tax=Halorubrum sp. DTA46 TaxID=3402162 RepID=UPI003AAE3D21
MSTVCVHGLGYIGLPTAAVLADNGHEVFGYDTDQGVRDRVRNADVRIDEPGLDELLERAVESGRLTATDEIPEAQYHIICVPTPFDEETRRPGLEYVNASAEAIAPLLREGDTVILESTVPPGTTETHVRPALEASGLEAGVDFGLAHCPETVLPGNILVELRENDRIVGGIGPDSTAAAVELYDSFVAAAIRTTQDPTTAEFVKLIQNTFRDVNIALANETARIAHDYDIDTREAIDLANGHPRVDLLSPGPGVGGHCLPIDPWFLGVGSDSMDLIPTARKVNDGMSEFVVDLVRDLVGDLDGTKIAVLGAAYKGNVDDTRKSPGVAFARELRRGSEVPPPATDGGSPNGPIVAVHDPHVDDASIELTDTGAASIELVDLETATTDADAVVITTDHDEFAELDPRTLRDRMSTPNVVDTKGILQLQRWRDAGFSTRRI